MVPRPLQRIRDAWSRQLDDWHDHAIHKQIEDAEKLFGQDDYRDLIEAAALAKKCGEAGAERLVGPLRTTLRKERLRKRNEVHSACLAALETQGSFAASAWQEINDSFTSIIGSTYPENQNVRGQAIHTVYKIGLQIISKDTEGWYTQPLLNVLPVLFDEREKYPPNIVAQLKAVGNLGAVSIGLKRAPFDQFFIDGRNHVERYLSHAVYNVRKQAGETLEELNQAIFERTFHRPISPASLPGMKLS
jgi:hypothetical protein